MGSLSLAIHWERIVLASISEFIEAEDLAAAFCDGGDPVAAQSAAYDALRRGMVAAMLLHHFADVALNRVPQSLSGMNIGDVRTALAAQTLASDGAPRPQDRKILGEVADSIKHGELTANHVRHVARNGRVIEWTHAPPSIFQEGKQTGEPQIVVSTANGTRSLRAILENVCSAWSRMLDL